MQLNEKRDTPSHVVYGLDLRIADSHGYLIHTAAYVTAATTNTPDMYTQHQRLEYVYKY
jgi:hypothetical protein